MSIVLAIWSFVSQPPVAAALVAGAGWIWSKFRGEKTSSWRDIVTEVGTALANEAISTWVPGGTLASGTAYVRDYIEQRIWSVMTKRNIPRNAITEPIVHYVVESATNAVSDQIANRLAALQLPAQLDDLAAKVAAVKDAFKVDPGSPMATLGRDIGAMVERVDDTATSSTPPTEKTP